MQSLKLPNFWLILISSQQFYLLHYKSDFSNGGHHIFGTNLFQSFPLHLFLCRYTSPDMCFHPRYLVRCLRCPLTTLVLRCSCPCSSTCQWDQWARASPWPTTSWEPCTRLAQRWWWREALMLAHASGQAVVFPFQWVSSQMTFLTSQIDWIPIR